MKKEAPTNDKKILKFLLEQQLPDARVVGFGRDGKPLAIDDAISVMAVDHVTHVALETCRCTHLQEHLPHLLDLDLCKAVHHPRGWVVSNPVHSMHLQTQLEDAVPPTAHDRLPPVLYGEEQQRTMALNTEGIVEFWCPLDGYSAVIHDDTAVEKMEHMPTLTNVHQEKIPVMVKYPSLIPPPSAPLANTTATSKPTAIPVGSSSIPVAAAAEDHPTKIPTISNTATTTLTATTLTPSADPLPPVSSSSTVSDPSEKPDPVSSTPEQPASTIIANVDSVQTVPETSSVNKSQDRSEDMDQDSPDNHVVPVNPSDHPSQKTNDDKGVPLKPKVEPETDQNAQTEPMESEDLPAAEIATPIPVPVPVPVPSDGHTEDHGPAETQIGTDAASETPVPNDNPRPPDAKMPAPITSMHVTPSTNVPVAASFATNSENERVSDSHPTTTEDEQQMVLSDEKFNHLRIEEDRIRLIRRSLSSHRIVPKKKVDPKKRAESNNKRKRDDIYKTPGIPGWHPSNVKDLSQEQEQQWLEAQATSRSQVERWIENFRICRENFWDEQSRQASRSTPSTTNQGGFYLPSDSHTTTLRSCQPCTQHGNGASTNKPRKPRRKFCGDDLMQCLDCNFIGCAPKSIAKDSKQHILQHLLLSGHKFAVSCGERGQLFCFCCGDFVYHEVFDQEKARIDYAKKVPLMAWKPHQLYRSFDPFHFMKTQDHGIVWRGLVATYPQLVPQEHVRATEATSRRQALFNGEVEETWLANKPVALTFAASQRLTQDVDKHRIQTPVGMFNLGNTCYKSAVLQCLVHCRPLQNFFLKQNGHHHHACKIYRQWEANKRKKKKVMLKPEDAICLACEMDKLYLSYYGNTIGVDVRGAMDEACHQDGICDVDVNDSLEKGDPLIISEMLTASWKSGGMTSLASYKQHDSHEFMNSFLEMVGKQTKQHWSRVHSAIHAVKNDSAVVEDSTEHEHDIVKTLFEGSLSSVLLCEECGNKRKRTEEFLNVSLSLAEQVSKLQSTATTTTTTTTTDSGTTKTSLSVERCLERFVTAEKLGDGVDCPSCGKKTATQKQHTFGTLPKVLCLHLKRFDAAQNKKIDDFVSFPAQGLNMGKYLAQWCEVSSLPIAEQETIAEPQIYYDLFGTVNHVGSMQSGHYVTDVKVNDRWYHFNDAHVSLAGGDGNADAVVNNAGAYILFYVRREKQLSSC